MVHDRYARMLVHSDEVSKEVDKVCSELCDPKAKAAKKAKKAKRIDSCLNCLRACNGHSCTRVICEQARERKRNEKR